MSVRHLVRLMTTKYVASAHYLVKQSRSIRATYSPVDRGYLYQYGKLYNVDDKCEGTPELLTDYTMRIVGHPFEWLAPAYRLK